MMHIGLLGFGVVGGGVWALCAPRDDLNVKRVLLRSRKEGLPEEVVTFNADDILNDPEIDTVVEVMGGLHPAYEYVSAALARGKSVVTANKALIAAYYTELTALAREKGAALRCTAAVGGGIPWLTNLERVKRLDTVCAVGGIMNGTTNFIMDAMHKAPVDFPAILKEAQDLGYAEADPSADIDGDDIRRKLCISANIAFDAALEETAIPTFGIRTVTAADIAAFQSHGFACKLLARAESTDSGVCAYVEPTLVDAGDLEAAVPANFNLITYGRAAGPPELLRPGRGALPHGGERGAGLPDGAVRQAGLLHRQGCAHVPDQRRGAPLLRPHQRTGCVPAGPHGGDVGQRRGHHRRGGRVRNAGLGQGSA